MRALVTGGAGFIGSHLTERLLADGHTVTVIDNYATGRPENLEHLQGNKKLTVVAADICDTQAIAPHFSGIDAVFHLAALADIVPSIEKPEAYFHSNVTGTFSVLQSAVAAGVKRFMYAASSSCYGIPDRYPTAEDAEIRPQYPYALTKRLGEELVMHWGQVYRLPVVSLRLFNVYGPRSRTSGTYGAVFGVFLAQKLAGKPFTVVGDGSQTRDFTFVSDVADAFLKAADSSVSQQIMNVGTGKSQSVQRLVALLGGEVTYIPKRPGEPDCTHADITKIQKLLGWKPTVSFERGVATMLEHIDYWKQAPVWTPQTIAKATEGWFRHLQ
jgi:UDP-glucose 4-epimerase